MMGQMQMPREIKNGEYITKHPDGSSLLATYKNNRLDGAQRTHYRNGVPEIWQFYQNGKAEGEYRYWYKDASLELFFYYQNNKIIDYNFTEKKPVFLMLKSHLRKNYRLRLLDKFLISDLSRSIYM